MKPVILVSACLLGYQTKYNGGNNFKRALLALKEKYTLLPFCPEVDGGLATPRPASEIKGEQVFNINGDDVTAPYQLGANIALELAKKYQVKYAIMKEKSPACGVNFIYDGTFTKTLIPGKGITARALEDYGVKIYHEDNFWPLLTEK